MVPQAEIARAYEQTRFLPAATDALVLQRSVDALERDVAAQARLAGETVPRPPTVIPRGLKGPQLVQMLLEAKFRALDNLVVVLRKRIAKLEQQSAEVVAMESDGVQSIQQLLKDLAAAREENSKLRLREARFSQDPLLRRRPAQSLSSDAMRSLIIALQNELALARHLIERHDMESHPAQRWLIVPPHAPPPPGPAQDIEFMLARIDAKRDPLRRDQDEPASAQLDERDELTGTPVDRDMIARLQEERLFVYQVCTRLLFVVYCLLSCVCL